MRKIILEDGKQPQFTGEWSIGEVLQMAQQLAAWVERLQVSQPVASPESDPKPNPGE